MARKQLQDILAELQLDTRGLNKYILPVANYVAELAGMDTAYVATYFSGLKAVLELMLVEDDVKAEKDLLTMGANYNFINDESIQKYIDAVDMLSAKHTARLTNAVDGRVRLDAVAELNSDINSFLFYDAKVFRAITWYVEALGHADIIADVATWIKPFTDLFTLLDSAVTAWEAITPDYKVMGGEADWISPYDIKAGIRAVESRIQYLAELAVAERDGTTPPEGTRVAPAMSVDTTSLDLAGTTTATLTLTPGTASDGTTPITITAAGSDDLVATVSGTTVTAIGVGTVTITGTASDAGSVTGSPITVTVVDTTPPAAPVEESFIG